VTTRRYEVSSDVASFAERAGFAAHDWDPQTTVLSTDGGETRYYVRTDDNGWFVITSADRSDPEYFELAGAGTDILDRYFLMVFGQVARGNRRMPLVKLPREINQLKHGYSITPADGEMQLLSDAAGDKLAVAPNGRIGTSTLVKLSHLADTDIDAVKALWADE
jgi:immunity protein 61 of polymorphic toxin system